VFRFRPFVFICQYQQDIHSKASNDVTTSSTETSFDAEVNVDKKRRV